MKPRSFPLTDKGIAQRDTYIQSLPEGQYECIIQPASDTRRSAQNRLMWLWSGQIANETGSTPNYVHGMCKLDILLPMMLAGEALHTRAAFIETVLDHVPNRTHKIGVAFDMIRTRDLSVSQFAYYLTTLDRHYADQGIALLSPDDLRNQALYNSREAQAA